MVSKRDQETKPESSKSPKAVKKQGNFKRSHPWRQENWREQKKTSSNEG